MNNSAVKTIVVGVCGGIAAYKAAELVSSLHKRGYQIEVIMTEAAQQLVAPLTFRTLSANPVRTAMFREHAGENVEHVALADRADLLVVVPATANMIGKVAHGIADDLLSTTIMAAACPVLFVPAMNVRMWENPIVQENVAHLREHGYAVLDPADGYLACGTTGKGRLPELAEIEAAVLAVLAGHGQRDLEGQRVLISAGPTVEPLDPVRSLTNRSSGKMGYALSRAAALRGATVTLVSGPVALKAPLGVDCIRVQTATEMQAALEQHYDEADIVLMAAAVADYRPAAVAGQKIKKDAEELCLQLVKNPDILRGLGARKTRQLLCGFAAETQDLETYAKGKLREKNLDLIIANDVSRQDTGFDSDRNEVTVFFRNGKTVALSDSKELLAHALLDEICQYRKETME